MRYHKFGKKVLELSLVSKIARKIVEARTRKAFLEKAVPLFQKELKNARFDIIGCATVSSMKDPESWGTRSDCETSRNIWRRPDKEETNDAVEDENKDENKDDDEDDAMDNDVENKNATGNEKEIDNHEKEDTRFNNETKDNMADVKVDQGDKIEEQEEKEDEMDDNKEEKIDKKEVIIPSGLRM